MPDFSRNVTRVDPQMPAGAYQTYEATAPLTTHWRPATCAEVECRAYMQGWHSDVPPGSADEKRITDSYRPGEYRLERTPEGFHRYYFPAGSTCFRAVHHKLPLERPALFTVRSGDWRGNPDGNVRQFTKPEDWVDHFAHHQDGISKLVNRG